MKWKRSKKAQQESKGNNRDSTDSSKISTNSSSPNCVKAGTSLSQDTCNSTSIPSIDNQSRKVQEGEPLYRPYVV